MNKRIILVGKGGSGKDYFKEYLKKRGYPVDISFTTRLPREGEIMGQTYHYVSSDKFAQMEFEGRFYESVTFNGWRYATTKKDWNERKLCIKTPSGIKQLTEQDREGSLIIYFDIPRNIRAERLERRVIKGDPEETKKEIGRRLAADTIDFKDFCMYDIRVTHPKFNCVALEKIIKQYNKL